MSHTGANSSAGSIVIMNGSATGAIGIGKASPSSGYIDIGGGSATNHQIRVNAPPEASAFEVYSNSETLLSVNGSTKKVGIGENETAPTSTLGIAETGSATNADSLIGLTNKANAASMINTRTTMDWNQWYYDGSSPAIAKAGQISIGTETNWTSTASTQDSYMAFSTRDGSASSQPTERVRITSAGNVGIGTTTPTEKLDVTGNVHVSGTITASSVVDEGVGNRYELSDYFEQKPGIAGDMANEDEAIRMIANRNFLVEGEGATSALVTFDTARAGILLTTDTTDGDEMVIMPHDNSNQTAWYGVKWGTENQVQWECTVTTNSVAATAKDTVRYVLGLGGSTFLPEEHNHSQYTDQVLFYYDSDRGSTDMLQYQTTSTTWHCVYSSNGTDYVTNLGLLVEEDTTYKFKIIIDGNRQPSVYINDTQYGLTTISGVGDTGVDVDGAVSLSGGASHVITVDGTDATTQIVVGDIITNSAGTSWGTVTAVSSATSITITASGSKSFPNNENIYIFGRAAATSTTKGAAIRTGQDLVPQVSVTTRTGGARTLTVHYQKISRNLI
jgi:hypothetical protein